MRVVHVAPTPFGRAGLFGGGERYPWQLAQALAGLVPTELVSFAGRPARWTDRSGLRVSLLRPVGRWRGHPAQPICPQLAWSLGAATVVHTHQPAALPSQLAAVTGRAGRRLVVTTDHGLGPPRWPGLYHRFLVVSRFSAQVLGAPPERTRVVHAGVDPDRFRPDGGRRAGVLFVGRLTPHKGVDRLLRALPAGASLTVAGSTGHDRRPPERDYPRLLHRLAADRDVRFTGPVPDRELPGLYRAAAVFVLPSVPRTCYGRPVPVSELFGLSVLEAMASGTPVVASAVGGLPEVVRDGDTGFLVPPGDLAALADRLARLLDDQAQADRMGRAARADVLHRFTWAHCARRCLAAYRELLEAHPGSGAA